MSLIKSISGIRGTIGGSTGSNLTPVDTVKFASAYGTWLKENSDKKKLTIVVGRDARISGKIIQGLVQNSIISLGIDIIDLGLSTTPTVELMVKHYKADGGIIVTASHNPLNWNALKLLNSNGEFVDDNSGQKIVEISALENFTYSDIHELGTIKKDQSSMEKHIESVLELGLVDTKSIQDSGLKVVVDGINSSGGVIVPLLLEKLKIKYTKIFCEPNGDFQHNPEPLKKNISDLRKKVITDNADLGIAVDPDVDRLVFVCENGEVFGEENTLVACADYVLSKTPGPTVSNLSSSRGLKDITESHNQQYFASAVGEVNVVNEMKLKNAIIGGEGNGGVIYPENHYGRDAIAGIALFLSYLCQKKIKCSDLLFQLPKYHMVKEKINLPKNLNIENLLNNLSKKFENEEQTQIDGLKIDFKEKWIHLRKSNTEPIIRIYSEAKSKEIAIQLVEEMKTHVYSIINQ